MTQKIKNTHDNILNEIGIFLSAINIETDLEKQINLFYSNPEYKHYTGIRKDKGYNNWKQAVLDRFENHCCICFSKEKLVAHHLYSYKYYSNIRTELNNGVCICNTCHEHFNFIYMNVNTLEQFQEFRKLFLGKSHKYVKDRLQKYRIKLWNINSETEEKSLKKINKPNSEERTKIKEIIAKFEQLKSELISESNQLSKEFGFEKGIKIEFRGKQTTSLSAISKLRAEVMRINTLIRVNKIADKSLLASKFHMDLISFCNKIENPKEYLNFTPSEITHLSKIISDNYDDNL